MRRREAGVPVAAVGIDDPEVGAASGRTEPVAGDDHLGLLTDDVAAQPQPGATGQLEAEPDRFPERAGHRLGQARRLEDDEERARETRERREPMEPVRNARRAPTTPGRRSSRGEIGRQIDQQQVDRAAL